jgi:hypothetical protein
VLLFYFSGFETFNSRKELEECAVQIEKISAFWNIPLSHLHDALDSQTTDLEEKEQARMDIEDDWTGQNYRTFTENNLIGFQIHEMFKTLKT